MSRSPKSAVERARENCQILAKRERNLQHDIALVECAKNLIAKKINMAEDQAGETALRELHNDAVIKIAELYQLHSVVIAQLADARMRLASIDRVSRG